MKKSILYISLVVVLGLYLLSIAMPNFTVPMKRVTETIFYGDYSNPSLTIPFEIYIPKDFNKTKKEGQLQAYVNYRLPFVEPVHLTNFDKDQLDSLSGLSSLTVYISPTAEHEESMKFMNTLSGGLYRTKHIEVNKCKEVLYTETIPYLETDTVVPTNPDFQCYYAFPVESDYYLIFLFYSTYQNKEKSIKIQQQVISTLEFI